MSRKGVIELPREAREFSIEELEKKLYRYKETIGFIRDITSDYRDKPDLGLEAIRTLLRGVPK